MLGREVYTSNGQLGGIQIMYNNGISHAVATDDYDGVRTMLHWLSYVPKHRGGPLPAIVSMDPVDRDVEFMPTKVPYDPRWMLAGKRHEVTGSWLSGFFDRGSFQEIMAAWAQTVVCGRARCVVNKLIYRLFATINNNLKQVFN